MNAKRRFARFAKFAAQATGAVAGRPLTHQRPLHRVRRRTLALVGIWVAFIANLFLAAGLLLSDNPGRRTLGVALILGAAAILVGLTLLFYVKNRRQVQPPAPRP